MPGFKKDEGIILKRANFAEADRILTIFTKNQGKIHVLAKGVRKISSRKGGSVELLNWCVLSLVRGKNFDLLVEVQTKNAFSPLKKNLPLLAYAYHIIELIDSLTVENKENPQVFELLIDILNELSRAPRQILLRYFEIQLLKHLGFWSLSQVEADPEILSFFKTLENLDLSKITGLLPDQNLALSSEIILRYYIEEIIEKELKSPKFLEKIRNKSHAAR